MRCRGVSPTIACGLSLVVLAAGAATVPSARAKGDATPDCSRTSVGSTPLIDLSSGTYRGYAGGLYLGSNTPPAAYLAQGLDAARSVRPLDPAGSPTPS